MNYCINAAWHGGNKPVALLRCNGSPGCFDSSLQVCIVGSGVAQLLLTKPHIFSMGFRSGEFAGQSSTVTPWSLNPFGTFGSVGRCQVMLENEISISIKLVSRSSMKCSKMSCNGCADCGLQKTQWTSTRKLHTGLQVTWILCSALFLQTLGS